MTNDHRRAASVNILAEAPNGDALVVLRYQSPGTEDSPSSTSRSKDIHDPRRNPISSPLIVRRRLHLGRRSLCWNWFVFDVSVELELELVGLVVLE
jgi:hypothetical protein